MSANSGFKVTTATGLTGQTKNSDSLVNGKICVYLDDGSKMMCNPRNLKQKGFID
jgi:hypothetical protein